MVIEKGCQHKPRNFDTVEKNNKVLEIFEYLLTTEQVGIRIIAINIERTRISSVRVLVFNSLFYFIL